MSKEVNKKQIKVASGKGEYATENKIYLEIKAIKKDVKEVKKILSNNNKEKDAVLPDIKVKKEIAKINKLEILEDKLFAQLSDGRELSIPIDWFAKWGIEGVNAKKLKKYEIWEGDEIYFPDIDEVLGVEKFTNGFDAPCE